MVVLGVAIEGARLVARFERRRSFAGEPSRPPAHPYRPLTGVGVLGALRSEFADESRWRDVIYVGVNLPLAFIEALVVGAGWLLALALLTTPIWYDAANGTLPLLLQPFAGHDTLAVTTRTVLGLALLPVAASLSQLVIALHRGVVSALLCTSRAASCGARSRSLRESRSAVLDTEASELHRIERDLHDGAQQRLVMPNIDLGLAAERLDADPAAARALILEGQAQAREALAEIRDLVRGIAPRSCSTGARRGARDRSSVAARSRPRSSARSHPASACRRPRSGPRTSSRRRRWRTWRSTARATSCEVRLGPGMGAPDRRGPRRRCWRRGRGARRRASTASRHGSPASTGRSRVSSPPGGPTVVRAEIPIVADASQATVTTPGT